MRPVRLLLLAVVAAAALVTPASAAPERVIRLAWNERAQNGATTVMTFHVRTLTIEGRRWTIDASFRNTSRVTMRVRKQFALLHGPSGQSVRSLRVLPARSFRPAMPATLPPGRRWSGTFSGTGATALRNTYVRAKFSFFAGRAITGTRGFAWVTDHVARVR